MDARVSAKAPLGGSLFQIAPVIVLFTGSRVSMEWQILKQDRVNRQVGN
jgi:hypothetical protein